MADQAELSGSWPPALPRDPYLTVPSAARVYDFMLGGKDNFAVDRQVVEQMIKAVPDVLTGPRAMRACLRRAVRHMVTEAGIDQFIDLGSGLPTEDNVHQVAQRHSPGARVVYVDNDPVAAVHGAALLVTDDSTAFIEADIRDVDGVLDHPRVRRLIDLDRPVGLIMCSVLHYMPDEVRPAELVAAYSGRMPPKSHLFLTHVCRTGSAASPAMAQIFQDSFGGRLRTREEVEEFFAGWTLIEPGIVPVVSWRPDVTRGVPASSSSYQALIGGLGRK
jgi:S-adenosyl methyltransferase